MHDHYPTILAPHDHDRLQAMMCTMIGARTPLADLLRRKLSAAVVMLAADIDADVAASGRRIRFKVDGDESVESTLTWHAEDRDDSGTLSLQQMRGLSLLGLRAGQSISYPTDTRRNEFAEIEHVFPDEAEAAVGDPDQADPSLADQAEA